MEADCYPGALAESVPLVVATGAGAASRVAVGLAVVGGMIAATFFSLTFVPSFFVVFQSTQEWMTGSRKKTGSADDSELTSNETPDDEKVDSMSKSEDDSAKELHDPAVTNGKDEK